MEVRVQNSKMARNEGYNKQGDNPTQTQKF